MTRDDIDTLIANGQPAAAATALRTLLRESPQAATAAYATARFEQIADRLPLTTLRVAILRSFTIEPMVPVLRARAYAAGIDLRLMLGDHNVIATQLIDPGSALHAFAADVVIVAALTRDMSPALWRGEGNLDGASAELGQQIGAWIGAFRQHSPATIIVQSMEQPAYAADGIVDATAGAGQRRAIHAANELMAAAAASHRGVYLLDYDALVARHGRLAWADPHKDLAMRVPLRPDAYAALADEYLRFLYPLAGKTCKVLAVDLDNTLWGGIIGEDGPTGIRIGVDYPGSAYLALQRQLKALRRRGVLLAICSKNNVADAMAVLRDHPEMLLRPDDFSAIRMNWDDKAANLEAIAAELNVGIESIAFLDDNPAERDWVRSQLPAVYVIDVGDDPVQFGDAISRAPVFERLELSQEDRVRGQQYRNQRDRATAAAASATVDEFLRSLEMKATIDDVRPATLARVAQLTQKTNQFNVTTRRYTEEEINRFAGEPGRFVRTIRVVDRYGDNGLVGVLMAKLDGERCEIDTMLLSCRVIGRDVETTLLADAAALARARGARVLSGHFSPTAKNAPASDVYARHAFEKRAETDTGSWWELDLTRQSVTPPAWIEVRPPS